MCTAMTADHPHGDTSAHATEHPVRVQQPHIISEWTRTMHPILAKTIGGLSASGYIRHFILAARPVREVLRHYMRSCARRSSHRAKPQ